MPWVWNALRSAEKNKKEALCNYENILNSFRFNDDVIKNIKQYDS